VRPPAAPARSSQPRRRALSARASRRRAPAERLQEYERTRQRIFSAADAAPAANGNGRGGRGGRGGEGVPERLGAPAGRGRGGFPGPAGGKAQMRNRDEERRDPDFLRDHARCAARRAPAPRPRQAPAPVE